MLKFIISFLTYLHMILQFKNFKQTEVYPKMNLQGELN